MLPTFITKNNLTYEAQMQVNLLHFTPLLLCANAIRTCWQSFDKSDNGGEIDLGLIDRVGNQYKHKSTLEHISYHFELKGISRACLQELARHRLASLSVKSTRYTLKELRGETSFLPIGDESIARAKKYLVFTPLDSINHANIATLENLRLELNNGIANDIAKYMLPECYKTELRWSINARSLQNFLLLRSSNRALWEIRLLAFGIYNALPSEHKFLFTESMQIDGADF